MRAHFLSNRHHIHWQLAVPKGGQDIDGSTMGHLAPSTRCLLWNSIFGISPLKLRLTPATLSTLGSCSVIATEIRRGSTSGRERGNG